MTIWSGTEKIFNIYSKRRKMGVIAFTNNNESNVYIIGGVNGNQDNIERISGEDNQLVTLVKSVSWILFS